MSLPLTTPLLINNLVGWLSWLLRRVACYNGFIYFKYTASSRVVGLNDCSLLSFWFSFDLQNIQTVSYMAMLLCVFLCRWYLFSLFIISPQTCFILLFVFSLLLLAFFHARFCLQFIWSLTCYPNTLNLQCVLIITTSTSPPLFF